MCFSATSSFVVATALTGVGLMTTHLARGRPVLLHATIPLLFAVQQSAEGIVWLTMNTHAKLHYFFAYIFIFFAFLVWPVMIPASLLPVEKRAKRKLMLRGLLGVGLLLALVGLIGMIFYPLHIGMESHHIMYYSDLNSPLIKNSYLFFYGMATVLPFLIVSGKMEKYTGIILLIALLLSYYFNFVTFISIWCYFAAIISSAVLIIVWD